jgi:hypothetical protein
MAQLLDEIVQVVCEWDIGQDQQVFATQSGAEDWVIQALINGGIDDPLEELEDQGLVAYNYIKVVWEGF